MGNTGEIVSEKIPHFARTSGRIRAEQSSQSHRRIRGGKFKDDIVPVQVLRNMALPCVLTRMKVPGPIHRSRRWVPQTRLPEGRTVTAGNAPV